MFGLINVIGAIRKNARLYADLKCKYETLQAKFFDSDGNPWSSDTPTNADLDADIPNGTFVIMDGTDDSFPRGSTWYKF